MKMQIPVYETENFYIQAASRPFIDRTEGGHMYVCPKATGRDRTQLSPKLKLVIEYTKLTMVAGGGSEARYCQAWLITTTWETGAYSIHKARRSMCRFMVVPPRLPCKSMVMLSSCLTDIDWLL